MHVVHSIIAAFGGQVAMSDATGIPQQTISEWATRSPPEIPPWRRPAILGAVNARNKELGPDAAAYLASNTRTPRQKVAA
jgi:hypothetical protein